MTVHSNPTTLTDKRLLEIDDMLGSDSVYELLQAVNSDIQFLYVTLKSMRITASEFDKHYIDAMLRILEENQCEPTREYYSPD